MKRRDFLRNMVTAASASVALVASALIPKARNAPSRWIGQEQQVLCIGETRLVMLGIKKPRFVEDDQTYGYITVD